MLIKNITMVYQNTLKTLQRFPLPTIFSLLICYFCLYCFDSSRFWLPHSVIQNFGKYCHILLFGFLFFIVLKLFMKYRKESLNSVYFLGTTLFSTIAWYLYTRPTSIELICTSGFLVTGLFFSLVATPCFYKPSFSLQSWNFIYKLCSHLCFSILSSSVLYLCLFFILKSIEQLFDFVFYDNLFIDIRCITFTTIFHIVFMSGIPKKIDNLDHCELKYINTILNYLIAPMLLIYTVIIWVYLLKATFTYNLLKNSVIWSTSIFGCLGIITYLLSYPTHHHQSIIGAFGRHFFKLLPLHLLAFSVALGTRIYRYGITEPRYFFLLLLIWLIFSTGVSFVRKADEVPKYVLLSLTILLFAASLGPWSAVNISTASQHHRLAIILEKNQILIAGKLQKPQQQLTLTDYRNISSIITYLVNREKIDCLQSWLTPNQIAQINQKARRYREKMIMQAIGVEIPVDPKRAEG